jgi:PAS domain S-box-containing protein
MFGYSRPEVTGQRMVDLIIPPEVRHTLEGAFTSETSMEPSALRNRQLQMRAVRKDGTALPIELAIVRVELPEGVFFIAHIRDITERKAYEQEREKLLAEAEKANNVKDDLLANLSHEFRTPLNAILGWSTMLRRRQVPPERLSHVAEVIERNAQTQSRLVDDLLDASLAVAGLLRLQMSAVDVASVLRAAAESIRPTADGRALVVECHAPANLGTIHADAPRLHQVLLNLLSNAVKFTSAGGTITLDALRDDGVVTIRVTDTGVGIAADFLPFIFERFRQADTSTTRSHGGVGLGLAFVKHLVGVMGGEITAESEGVGKGASFSVRFQASEGQQIQRPQPSGVTTAG